MDYKDSDVAIKVESSTAILNEDLKVNITVVLYWYCRQMEGRI